MSDGCVTVDKTIAKSDDLLVIGDASGNLREETKGLSERLANHLEVAFDGGAQQGVILVVAQLLAVRKNKNVVGGALDVPQIALQATWHRAFPAGPRSPPENTDCERHLVRPGPPVGRKAAPRQEAVQSRFWHRCQAAAAQTRPRSQDRCAADQNRRAAPSRTAPAAARGSGGKAQQPARVFPRFAVPSGSPVGYRIAVISYTVGVCSTGTWYNAPCQLQ